MTTPYCPVCGSVRVKRIHSKAGICGEPDCYTLKPWREFTGHSSSIAESVPQPEGPKPKAPMSDDAFGGGES